jgi:BREX system ATP-binding protein BrxC/D
MLVSEALSQYPDEDLGRLARDKVDEVANLRLPREVLIQEIAAALSSLSYVAKVVAPARPPTYAFLKLLMDAPERRAWPREFRETVQGLTDELTAQAASGEGLARNKDYALYLRMLYAAWEDDGRVDRSEALLLAALRKELGLWTREHLLLEHHPLVRPIWDSERAYAEARNNLLATGLVLVHEGAYVLPEEVALQVRRVWEIDLGDAAYQRLLNRLTGKQLRTALEAASLPLSGSKEERVERIVRGLVPPAEILDALHINDVKDLCRGCSLPVSAAKADLVASLVDHFDAALDLAPDEGSEQAPAPLPEPEERSLTDEQLSSLLGQLTVDLLYDLLAARGLRRSGSKTDRAARLVASPWSERTLLGHLRRADLVELCRKLGVQVSGVKAEIIERLITWASEAPAGVLEREDESQAVNLAEGPQGPRAAVAETEASPQRIPPGQPAPPPPGLKEVEDRFPTLEADEQVVMALLHEARSLNEREIERVAGLHGLGWFLTKAHMAALVEKLRRGGDNPVRMRTTGRLNIYEWKDADSSEQRQALDQMAARDLVDALRQGVVPERHLELLAVGQEDARQHLVELLQHVAAGRSECKFLRGAYGAGKTFLCSWLREQAFNASFAVATVRIGPDQPLSELPVFFSGLIDGLRTPEKRDASALADVLESWLLRVHRETARDEGSVAFGGSATVRLLTAVEARIDEELAGLADVDPGFSPALRAFYRARVQSDHETASTALSWLRGGRSLPASALSAIGVRGQLAADEVFPRMRALLRVIAGGSLRGLLLVVDELELVRRFPQARQRERSYETLRLLVDECGENRLPRCLLLCTGTDQLFEDERYGLASYRALSHRVSPPQTGLGAASVRQPILALEPLDRDRLLHVALRVRDIHALAYGWPAAERVPDSVLERMVEEWTVFGDGNTSRLPRPVLREVVHLLDLCQERPEVPAEEYLRGPTEPAALAGSVLSVLEQ